MWKKIRLVNFRLFEDTKDLELAPLTFLIGPNGSGKSTLIKSFLLLKQSAESRNPDNPLTPDGDLCKLGHYPDYIHNGDVNRNLEIQVEWTANKVKVKSPIRFHAAWSIDKTRNKVNVQSFCYRLGKKNLLKAERISPVNYQLTSDYVQPGEFKDGVVIEKITRYFSIPHNVRFNNLSDDFDRFQWDFSLNLQDTIFQSALREPPKETYKMPGPEDRHYHYLGLQGERAFEVIGILKSYEDKISEWAEKIGLAKDIRIKHHGENIISILVSNVKTGFRSNLPYVGFGVHQVFPILAQGLWCEPGSTLMLEQPEIHLNPKMQAELADVFIELILSEEHHKQLIIETHSEHFLSRVRTRIADGSLDKDKVAIYYCDLDKNGGKIKRLHINDYGQYQNWPKGFFAEGIIEALAQTEEAFKRNKKKAAGD